MSWLNVTNPYVFGVIAGALVGYILYMMIRKRRGERSGFRGHEPEL
jgi:hypothetical protein